MVAFVTVAALLWLCRCGSKNYGRLRSVNLTSVKLENLFPSIKIKLQHHFGDLKNAPSKVTIDLQVALW